MKNIDKFEIIWRSIEDLDETMLDTRNGKGDDTFLVKTNRGEIKVVRVATNSNFIKEQETADSFYFDSSDESNPEVFDTVKEYAEYNQFILYAVDVYEEYGDYAGRDVTIFNNIIEIAEIPDNPIINAIYNYNY